MKKNLNELITKIENEIKIEEVIGNYISLQRKGNNFWAICPFHKDTSPSLSVSPTKKIFKCFSCGAGGNVIGFVQRYKNVSFLSALKTISQLYQIDYTQYFEEKQKHYSEIAKRIFKLNQDALDFFTFQFEKEANKADSNLKKYIDKRQLTLKIAENYQIGFNPKSKLLPFLQKKGYTNQEIIEAKLLNNENIAFENRLIFPIINEDGFVVGFSARTILENDKIKYINSQESDAFKKTEILWNLNNIGYKEDALVLFEGFFDVISWEQKSKEEFKAIATMGVAFNQKLFKTLKSRTNKLIIGFDKDQAGLINTIKIANLALINGFRVEILHFENAKDIDEAINNDEKFSYLNYFLWFIDIYLKKIVNVENIVDYDLIPKQEIQNFLNSYKRLEEYELIKKYFEEKISIAPMFFSTEPIESSNKYNNQNNFSNQPFNQKWKELEIKHQKIKTKIIEKEHFLICLLIENNHADSLLKLLNELSLIDENLENFIKENPTFFDQQIESSKTFLQIIPEWENLKLIVKNYNFSNTLLNEAIVDLSQLNEEFAKIELLLIKNKIIDLDKSSKLHKRIKEIGQS